MACETAANLQVSTCQTERNTLMVSDIDKLRKGVRL